MIAWPHPSWLTFITFWLLSMIALGDSSSSTASIEWIEPPRQLAQGKIALRIRLIAQADVQLEEWVAQGWGANFSIFISRIGEKGSVSPLPPATPRGLVKLEKLELKRGETRDLSGEFILNNEPGDYELSAQLIALPGVRSKPIRFSVKTGQVLEIRK